MPIAVEKEYRFEGRTARRACRPSRGAVSDRLPRLLRARRGRLARGWLPRLLLPRRPGRPPRPPERPRHHPRVRLPRPAARHRALEGARWLGVDPVVLADGRLRRRFRRSPSGIGPMPSSVKSTEFASHLLPERSRRRGDGPLPDSSTSPHAVARRRGRTHRRATRIPRPTRGGTSATIRVTVRAPTIGCVGVGPSPVSTVPEPLFGLSGLLWLGSPSWATPPPTSARFRFISSWTWQHTR